MTDILCKHRQQRSPQGGFTLVEIMISIAVLSIITLGTLTAMRTLANTQESLNLTTDRVDEMRQVSQFLRHSLQQAQGAGAGSATSAPSTWGGRFGGGSQTGLVLGEADEIIWSAPLDSIQGMSGITYIRLYQEDNQLKLQFLPTYMAPPDMTTFAWEQAGEGYLLVSDVEEFAVAYRPLAGDPWVDRLEAGPSLPQSIGLTIRARGRYWPQIVVSPYGASY